MFFAEAKISALLHHQNIVQVYDFGQVNGWYFLAMEYLEGKDVATILRALRPARRAIPPSLAAHVGREVVAGLQYVHKLRSADDRPLDIVHRDVSPANVMLLRTGRIKLLDFGIALASDLTDESPAQRAGLKGKLSYMSPEQARCEPLDRRSDLFSWGATTWEMLTGVRLFGGKSDLERVTAVKQMPVPPPSTLRPAIPAALDRIVLRALARDRALRYQSAEELAGDLTAFLKTSPPPQDAVTRLLSELFGRDSASGTMPSPAIPGRARRRRAHRRRRAAAAEGAGSARRPWPVAGVSGGHRSPVLEAGRRGRPGGVAPALGLVGDGRGPGRHDDRRDLLLLFARAPAPSTASTAPPKAESTRARWGGTAPAPPAGARADRSRLRALRRRGSPAVAASSARRRFK